MSDCQTKLDDIKKNCNDLYKSSCQQDKIEPEWGICSYSGRLKDDSRQYSGETRCYRGQMIQTQYEDQLCPSEFGDYGNTSVEQFKCTFVSDSEKNFSIFVKVSIVIAILLFLVYYFYIRKRK